MEELFVQWRTMWDAKEYTTQLFFLFNLVFAVYVVRLPFRAVSKDTTALNRGILVGIGIGYALLIVYAYIALVPTFSPYE